MPKMYRYAVLFFFLLLSVRVWADVVVFKNGNRMEVQDLVLADDHVTYTLDGMTITIPTRYLDIDQTRRINEENQRRQAQETREKAVPQSRLTPGDRAAAGRVSSLGRLGNRTISDAEIQAILEKWQKRTRITSHRSETGTPAGSQAPDGPVNIPFVREGGIMIVNAQVNGCAARFIFDTGASLSMITADLARRANVEVDYSTPISVDTAGGKGRSFPGLVKRLVVGGVEFRDLTVVVSEDCNFNLLGQHPISMFDVGIDNRGHQITLHYRR